MSRLRYTASGRLGVWDSIDKAGMETWRTKLDELLKSNAHGVVESNAIDFAETDDPNLVAITAVCDKIIARGNPTLVDPNWERTLLQESGGEFLRWEEPDDPEVNFYVKESLLPEGSSFQLLDAAKDLLDLGWSHEVQTPRQQLPADVRKLCSDAEDILYTRLISALGLGAAGVLLRQPLISDLVDGPISRGLIDNRVDFALQLSRVRWVIEVDGPEKEAPGQKQKDQERDKTLHSYGWKVLRVSNASVRCNQDNWNREKFTGEGRKEHESPFIEEMPPSVVAAREESLIHQAAWHLVLRPLAVQRCLRGLLLLYRSGMLDATRPQRILIVEEDMPAVADAFQMLGELWELTFSLRPELGVGPPEFVLDVIGQKGLQETGHSVRFVDQPEGDYDAVISHSLLLGEGYPGPLLTQVAPELAHDALYIRRSIGRRSDRHLQESKGFNYQLEDGCEIQENALKRLLQMVFRKQCFKDGQLMSISRLLRGENTIVLLPTGGGKSLIYQFAGMLLPGMTVIVDPIISLMDDQVYNLRRMGIDRIEGISGQQSQAQKKEALQRMAGGELSYIFISPERLQSKTFRIDLQQVKARMPVSLVVLDEAHCLSEWGHDFRPAYLHLPFNLRRYCRDKDTGDLPTLAALTGTASFAVLDDMQAEIGIDDEDAIIRPVSFDRKELIFDVRTVQPWNRLTELRQVREKMPQRWNIENRKFYQPSHGDKTDCGLVFCPHAKGSLSVVDVAAGLGHANFFFADMPPATKQRMQRQFIENEVQELVATKAFGMGIDKSNIRYTVHFVMPASVEQFYQEAGRAGRNGQDDYALCTVIYCHNEWERARELLDEQDHAKAMLRLNKVPFISRGDVLHHLWFLLDSYTGREEEKRNAFEFWKKCLDSKSGSSMKSVQIPFEGKRTLREKYVYRLAILGIVDDYTVDWNKKKFDVDVRRADSDRVRASLSNYLGRYKFQDYVDRQLSQVCVSDPSDMVEQAIGVLVDFIYDEVVAKRKQAIQNMAELCQDYRGNESFRREILAYLEESEFTELLNSWRGRSLEDVGLAAVRDVLAELNDLEIGDTKGRLRALIGTTRRMLEADPGSLALRYLSVVARSRSPWQSDGSVIDETEVLLGSMRSEVSDAVQLRFELLKDVLRWRRGIAVSVTRAMMSGEDGLRFARRLLAGGQEFGDGVRLVALDVVSSNVVETISGSNRFCNTLALKSVMSALDTSLQSVLGISQFHDLEQSGGRMTQDVNEDMSATIQEAEESILRISQELRRMKTAADLLEDAGHRSQLMNDSVESLVTEIGSLVGLSGRIIDTINELEVDRLATELRATLIQCIDGLKSEVTADARTATERVGAELQTALSRRIDILSSGITAKTESASDEMLKRLDDIDSQVAELRDMVDQLKKKKGIFV